MKTITKLWLLIVILIILVPLGIIVPGYFKSGPAFGEEKLSFLWKAPMPDYGKGVFAYIVAAILGVTAIAGVIFIAGKLLNKNEK